MAYCGKCANEYQNEYRRRRYSEDDEYREKQKAIQRRRNYGISDELYAELLGRQDGLCALCGGSPSKRALHVDHDHKTGMVRGLLCHWCNTALGAFRDDPKILRRAIEYLGR